MQRSNVALHVSLRGVSTMHLFEMKDAHLHLLVLVPLHGSDGSYLRSPGPSRTPMVRYTFDRTQKSWS